VASIQEDLKKSDKRDTDIDLGKKDPISVLIMGVDGVVDFIHRTFAGDFRIRITRNADHFCCIRFRIDADIDLGKKDPISVLIMGVDERKNDKGRADTMIYTSFRDLYPCHVCPIFSSLPECLPPLKPLCATSSRRSLLMIKLTAR
jgi:hypothetical protein